MDKKYELIGKRIKTLRLLSGESRTDLAKAIGVKADTINKYENGFRRPNDQIRIKIARHFGVSVDHIIYGE